MEPLLRNLVLVFLVAGGALYLFSRLKLPSIVGLLIAGVAVGPHVLGLLEDRDQIERLAEIGVLLLMFSIGLDFTRERLRELIYAAGVGTLQMAICIVATTIAAAPFVDRWAEAVFLGFLVAHTSSTLMLKLFIDRGELTTPPVRLGLGISITQDLSVVLMLIAVPVMAGGQFSIVELGTMLLRIAGLLAVSLVIARWAIPFLMDHVIRDRSRELFLVFLIVICLGAGWGTLAAGMSLGLGAFIAGIAIAESGYGHHTLSETAPFRDLLISVFFISTGMLLDLGALAQGAGVAMLLLLAVLVIKFLSGFVPVLVWGFPLRVAVTVGTAVAQIGEFGFVLAHAGFQAGLLKDHHYSMFLIVAVASMLVSPFLVSSSSSIAKSLARIRALRKLDRRQSSRLQDDAPLENHVIIAGFGLNGRNLATALTTLELPFVVLEMNPETVRDARQSGVHIVFGDCSRAEILRKVHIENARGLVLAISDSRATRQAVQIARHENTSLHIIVRTKYLNEIDVLRELGANEIVAEEFETSLEVLTLALKLFDAPSASIDRIIEQMRSNTYRALRGDLPTAERQALLDALMPQFDFETHRLPGDSRAIGRSLRDLDVRAKTGATILAVWRGSALITVPSAEFQLQEGDVLVLAGAGHEVSDAIRAIADNNPAA